jgi:hypothetical protein
MLPRGSKGTLAAARAVLAHIILALGLCHPSVAFAASGDLIAQAQTALKAGKADLTIKLVDAALSQGKLAGASAAKAYYLRGLALARLGMAAQAISDLSTALWLPGLSESERSDATRIRSSVFRSAGVTDPGTPRQASAAAPATAADTQPSAPPPQTTASIAPPDPPSTASAWSTTADSATDSPAGGSFKTKVAAARTKPVKQASATTDSTDWQTASASADQLPTASAPQSQSGWSSATSAPAANSADGAGAVFAQVAALRSRSDAQTAADRLASEHTASLAGLSPVVMPTVIGNMGTFYAVRLGPLPDRTAGVQLCAKLRQDGLDCYIVSR